MTRQAVRRAPTIQRTLRVPGDKSISHRAAIFNSLGEGEGCVQDFLPGEDCQATLRCLRALGVPLAEKASGTELVITGVGLHGLREPADVLDAGNSGTTMRLLAGLLAAQPFLSILTGDASLRSRPMGRIIQPLRQMGAQIHGRAGDTLAPLALRGGSLRGITYVLPVASAQLKSALLLAGLFAEGKTVLIEPAPSRDHTERMLRAMGASIRQEGRTIIVDPPTAPLRCQDFLVPGDFSSAAFWLVAGVAHPEARIVVRDIGVNPTRTGLLQVLKAMGASIACQNQREVGGEVVADLVAQSSELHGVEVGGDLIPQLIDEIPVLAVAAAVAHGRTIIRDAAELRVKESDRIATTARELARLGARLQELPDGVIIEGGYPLCGAACDSHGDHRLAMALGIAGLLASGETTIAGAEAAAVSYPGFWEDLAHLTSPPGGLR